VTQVLEGGWWEGTLRGITGWFPSNYVQEIKAVIGQYCVLFVDFYVLFIV